MSELFVRSVRGRYPRRGTLKSRNITAQVQEVGRVYRIRLDDEAHPEAWFELTIEVLEDARCEKTGFSLSPSA